MMKFDDLEQGKNLNENERKALDAIIATCDDLDGDLFTRLPDAALALIELFDMNGQRAGGYLRSLIDKGYLDLDEDDEVYGRGVWVNA